jgi:hypothetical protein
MQHLLVGRCLRSVGYCLLAACVSCTGCLGSTAAAARLCCVASQLARPGVCLLGCLSVCICQQAWAAAAPSQWCRRVMLRVCGADRHTVRCSMWAMCRPGLQARAFTGDATLQPSLANKLDACSSAAASLLVNLDQLRGEAPAARDKQRCACQVLRNWAREQPRTPAPACARTSLELLRRPPSSSSLPHPPTPLPPAPSPPRRK